WFRPTFLGFPKTDAFRARFLLEAVQDLRESLRALDTDLIIRIGYPEKIIPELAHYLEISEVYCSKEVTFEELKVEERLELLLWKDKIPLKTYWTSSLYHPEDLPFPISNLPDVFTQFRKGVEKGTKVRASLPPPQSFAPLSGIPVGELPTLEDFDLQNPVPDSRSVLHFRGGEQAAKARMHHYFWEKNLLKEYKETRNGLLGADYSSKFSAWLALGCISPRTIFEEVKKYEQEVTKNQSTYWLIFELIWRDYFRMVAHRYGNRIFKKGGIQQKTDLPLKDNLKIFQKWADGQTGIPFIDANMRELNQTGFMSNRGRQNVASFLVKDLRINWVWGAMYFESKLIDYDVCSNWGNWNYVAGIGNDPRENRYFNILTQAKRYDAQAEYVKHWLPELASIPKSLAHHPSDLKLAEQKKYGLIIGVDYPNPLVNPDKWRKRN
ncbi:MAG: DASH family cryptochrome, partial [Bacteroidota bacterium]